MHAQVGIKTQNTSYINLQLPFLWALILSWFLGTWIITEYEKSYQKLAFVFDHDNKIFEGNKKFSGLRPSSFICLLMFWYHGQTFLRVFDIHNIIPGGIQSQDKCSNQSTMWSSKVRSGYNICCLCSFLVELSSCRVTYENSYKWSFF